MQNIKVIANNPMMRGLAYYKPNVIYSTATGTPLTMELIIPSTVRVPEGKDERYPLIVFIQGSAWTHPDVYFEIPQLSQFAQQGYVVATLTHRSCFDAPSPAFLEDVKTAIRYLRAHAEEYHIDKNRVCAWGTSSGGNTAMLLGMTADTDEFDTCEYADESSKVQLVVECFGPTDLVAMVKNYKPRENEEAESIFYNLAGGPIFENLDKLARISPITYVDKGKELPPYLLLHGDADPVVDYNHTLALYKAMLEHNYDVRMVRVPDAPHEGSFWSQELFQYIMDYIKEKL